VDKSTIKYENSSQEVKTGKRALDASKLAMPVVQKKKNFYFQTEI
jgi:hypothetical protein